MKAYVLTAALLLVGPTAASAEDPALERCREQLFEKADKNSDGVLTAYEAAPEPLRLEGRFFELADANRDGVVDFSEYRKLGIFVSCEICPGARGC